MLADAVGGVDWYFNGLLGLNVDGVSEWLRLYFEFDESRGKPKVAVWYYLKGLSDLGIFGNPRKQEFVVAVSGWSAALEVAKASEAPGKRPQVWSETWPDGKHSQNLARAFAELYGERALWERVAGLLLDVRERESPTHVSLHCTATLRADPELLRRYFLSAGFTRLAPAPTG